MIIAAIIKTTSTAVTLNAFLNLVIEILKKLVVKKIYVFSTKTTLNVAMVNVFMPIEFVTAMSSVSVRTL